MKRIAVISSFACIKTSCNYGALLQYYALQEYLTNKGYYVYWLRFECYISFIQRSKNFIKNLIKHRFIYLSSLYTHRQFMKFCSKHLHLSTDKYIYGGNQPIKEKADIYITGSDQVWGGTLSENYLTFVNEKSKKIAYAASFGKDNITEEHRQTIKPWLANFSKVSVREHTGVDICHSMDVDAIHLIDPTLLLDMNQYPHLCNNQKKPYVFCYFLNIKNKDMIGWKELVKYCKRETLSLKVCAVQGAQYVFNNEYLVFPSPQEWLTYYHYAENIVTNTFHGTVFAIIHRKPFVCILQKGASANQNTRMTSLLKLFRLEDRIAKSEEDILPILYKSYINWKYVESVLYEMRKRSDSFLTF